MLRLPRKESITVVRHKRRAISIRAQSRNSHRRQLRFEPLEDRCLLTIFVNTLLDENNGAGVGAGTSLREAIAIAPPNETIRFAAALTVGGPATMQLSNLGQLLIDKSLTIQGPGADLLTIRAYDPTPATKNGDGSRVFNINDNVSFSNADVEISGLTLSGGDADNPGGAIASQENLSLNNCVVRDNHALFRGGGIHNYGDGNLLVAGSTISGNTTTGLGGGISNEGQPGFARLTIRDSTISGNFAPNGGGGVYVGIASYTAVITGSTITGNSTTTSGGGILADSASEVELNGSIVAGNTADQNGTDLYSFAAPSFTAAYSLIGNNSGTSLPGAPVGSPDPSGNLIGTAASPIDPLLAPLTNNGGPTATHALLPGSPARNAGDPSAAPGAGDVPLFDQRGAPFTRMAGGRIDMGAIEAQIVVDSLLDENDGNHSRDNLSLCEALALANADPAPDAVTFDPALFAAGPGTILLTMGQLSITTNLSIGGPGDDTLTIDASGNDPTPDVNNGDGSRVFRINDNTSSLIDVVLTGLMLTGGDVSGVGGAVNCYEHLTVNDATISGNFATVAGGGINNREYTFSSHLAIERSVITGNSSGSSGGGITNYGDLTVNDSTISGNTAPFGGGINIYGNVAIRGSTISGNTALSGRGGGAHVSRTSILQVTDSTISGNKALGPSSWGGGIFVSNDDAEVMITNSTISDNDVGGFDGGGIYSHSLLTVAGSTIFGNSAPRYGGGVSASNGVSVMNSMIAGNSAGANSDLRFSSPLAISFSLIGNNAGTTLPPAPVGSPDANGNLIGTPANPIDPKLAPLADNGGPTWTRALLPGSPALEAGDPAALAGVGDVPLYDQRGTPFARVVDGNGDATGRIDMGAFESQFVLPALWGDYNQNGAVDAADYVLRRKMEGSSAAPFSGADGSGNGLVDDADDQVWRAQFGNSNLPPPPALPGDYNLNHLVDAADYVVWRKMQGATGLAPYSSADGNGDGNVNDADYVVWQTNFANTPPETARSAAIAIAAADSRETIALHRSSFDATVPFTAAETAHTRLPATGRQSVRCLRAEPTANASSHDHALAVWLATHARRPNAEQDLEQTERREHFLAAHDSIAVAIDECFAEFKLPPSL